MLRRFLLSAIGAAALALGTSASAQAANDTPLTVVATTGMIADTARQIGGDRVEVRALMGSGVDPHAYRQTRTDIVAMTRADLVLWHGLYLEAQMEEFFADLGKRTSVVAVADALPKDILLSHEDYADRYDPHVWMNPDMWQMVIDEIARALIAAAPAHEDDFRQNADAYKAQVAQLGTYARDVLATVPAEARVLITAHDAFKYFGSAYGFEVMGIQGISTQSEAGLRRIADLVDVLVTRDIGAVFVESSVSDRNMRALIEGAVAAGQEVQIGGELFSDAMGTAGTYEGTYVGMIDHNISVIADALGGTVPDLGMSGRLSAGF